MLEELKEKERETMRRNRLALQKVKSQGEIDPMDVPNPPETPGDVAFSPKEALYMNKFGDTLNSNGELKESSVKKSLGLPEGSLKGTFSTATLNPRLNDPYFSSSLKKSFGSKYFKLNQKNMMEGRSQQALKRFEEYEKKRKKIMKRIKNYLNRKDEDLKPDGPNDPDRFLKNSNEKVKDAFRETRYNERRLERLMKWRDKRYNKFHSQVRSYDTTSKRLFFDERE
ncbi:unnamed protein product [Moneuplotes crassus]|uniref:Uncharacterized protein n=1 Tax=Euplotes crassus TaxID=5936 RepID=A0AAD2D4Y5_EUPCR|nr:unnamed protein product [Moneuplotes crassus]